MRQADRQTLEELTIPDGQTMILASVARQGKSGKALVIVITPHILKLGETQKIR